MRYFGDPTDAPVYEGIDRAATPVGRSCLYCQNPIADDDQGFLIPNLTSLECGGGTHTIGESPWHRRCLLENVLGPMAEQLERRREDDEATPRF